MRKYINRRYRCFMLEPMTCTKLALLALLPFTLCAQKITTEFDETRDFSAYRTFALQDGKIHSKNPSLNNDLVVRRVTALVRQRLAERGLTEVPARADLNVSWSLGSGRRTEVERYGIGWRGGAVVHHYTEGTLILKLRDAKQRELVWQAIAVTDKSGAAKIQAALDDMVRKSFEKYPPKKK